MPDPEWTRGVVQRHIEQPEIDPIFNKVEALLTGARLPERAARAAFWNGVIFCNLVQRLLPTSADRPIAEDWVAGRRTFVRLLREQRPDAVLVLGVAAWNGLSHRDFLPSRALDSAPSSALFEWEISPGCSIVTTWVVHPTGARGKHRFRLIEWQGRVRELMHHAQLHARERGWSAS